MITAIIEAAERVRLSGGQTFTRRNAETDAARYLIGEGVAAATPMRFLWHDDRPSTTGTVGAYARRYYGESGVRKWKPHPRAEIPVSLMQFAARIAPEPPRRRSVA